MRRELEGGEDSEKYCVVRNGGMDSKESRVGTE